MLDLSCGKAPDINGLAAEQSSNGYSSTTRGNPYKLFVDHCCINMRKHFFSEHIIIVWNSLLPSIAKAMTYEDFRGMAISPIISKLLEYCFIEKFRELLTTEKNNIWFQKSDGLQSRNLHCPSSCRALY